jgi:hypothetical protein
MASRCVAGTDGARIVAAMIKDRAARRRFEIKLPEERRRELDQLAHESGIPSAALAKLAIVAMLEQRMVRLPAAEARP